MEFRGYIVSLFRAVPRRWRRMLGVFILFLAVFDAWAISAFFDPGNGGAAEIYFLDVGQGDAQLAVLPDGARVLIDGGPANGMALREIERVSDMFKRRIDVVVLTHPEEDHFGGLIQVLRRIPVGAVITNGFPGKSAMFPEFERAVAESGAILFEAASGDSVRQGGAVFRAVSPDASDLPRGNAHETNEKSVVLVLDVEETRLLFSGDIGEKTERSLSGKIGRIDVLKVAHHGSKFSSSEAFLSSLRPKLAFVGVGKNSYGHPAKETLARLSSAGAEIFRTDIDHTLRLVVSDGIGRVYSLD